MTMRSTAETAADFSRARPCPADEARPGLLIRCWFWAYRAYLRAHTRRALRELPENLLADIGLTRDDVERETIKPFWR